MRPTPLRSRAKNKIKPSVCAGVFFMLAACLVWLTTSHSHASMNKKSAEQDIHFPLYPVIKPNVEFWVRVFTETSKYQGLLHDTKNLSIVYDTVQLPGSDTVATRKKNKRIKKKAIKKYQTILLKLATGAPPLTALEKKTAAFFGPTATAAAFKRAAYNIRIQTGLKEEFKGGLIRSGAFMDEFKRIFQSHGLPTDLVFLPCVESSYRYKAYSKFGAAGIWQFTHATGRQYMNIGYVVDERRDPFISTDAAARLLKKNFMELKEWPLAITAYNHGLNGMRRAKKSKGSYENIFKTYRSRSFKFASRNFYAEFLAARMVALNYEKYFGPLRFDTPRSFHLLKVEGFLSVRDIETSLQIKPTIIQALNPALRPPVFKGQKYIPKGFKLKLPAGISMKKTRIKLALVYKDRQKPSRFHRVQKGDTAGAVARQHSVSLRDLMLANGLNRRATIYVGQNLRIPVKGETIAAKKTMKKKQTRQPSAAVASAVAPAAKKAVPPFPPKKELPEPASETAAVEPLPEVPVNPDIVTSDLKVIKTIKTQQAAIGIIKVETDETLGHYADWLGVKTQTIRRLNRYTYGTPIAIGQTVKLPMPAGAVQIFEEKRYEFHKEMEEDFFESFIVQGTDVYEIKKGDNIWNLCRNELEIPFWLLKKYNPQARFPALTPSQKIRYPLIEKRKQE